jgi:hypothetical protein
MSAENVRLALQPDTDIRLLSVTPGFVAASWRELPASRQISVLAGSAFADFGWGRGAKILIRTASGTSGQLTLDAIGGTSMLGYERVLVTVAPPAGTVDVCLVTANPESAASVAESLRGWFGDGTSVQDVLIRSGLVSDPQQLVKARISQYGWIAGGFAIVAIMLGGWAARRGEFALYRLLGFNEGAILAMLVIDTLILALIPAQLGSILAISASDIDALVTSAFLLDWIRFDLVMTLIPLIGIAALPRRSQLSTLKGH